MAIALNSTLHEGNKGCSSKNCRNVWERTSHKHEARLPHLSSERPGSKTSLCKLNGVVRKGDRVLVLGSALERKGDINYPGTVEYIGSTDDSLAAPKTRVGVSLYDNVYSSHNGVYEGRRYFSCQRGHGAMVRNADIQRLERVPRTSPLSGNHMFPSYEGVKKRRRQRYQIIKEAEEQLSQEYERRRRAQMDRFSKSSFETYDLHHHDQREYLPRDRQKHTNSLNEDNFEETQLRKLKKTFGGDEKAERMIQTLRKLRRAFQEGLAITLAEKE